MGYKDKKKQSQYQVEFARKRRQAWLKDNGPCVKCGSWDKLEVDHIDPKTKVTHNVWSWTQVRRDEELAKCQALCKRCHFKKSQTERGGDSPHGSRNRYEYHGCRCEICKEGQREKQRRYRAKLKAKGTKRKN